MAYQVIARRWRPQTFEEVVFQEHISKTLQNSIERGRISHAYIFAGPRGVGKTTSARIFAKSLNCVNGPTPHPCGVCENCTEIRDGISFDVIEIDGASNNSVDDVRDLREKVAFAPVKGRFKVYIIDEVHMLSGAAFNALLKTLEEPPPHVIFVFATTEIHKLPETILSRCQKFFFKKITPDSIAAHLKKIAEKDGFGIDEKALYAIARAGEGSMRDAQSLLEQVVSFSNGSVSENDALAQLGIVPLQSYIHVAKSIADCSEKDIITEVNRVASSGADMARYVAGFSDIISAMRLVRNGIQIREAAGFSAEEVAEISEMTDRFHDEELSAFYKRCIDLQTELRYVQNDCACVEMALLDMCAIRKRPSLAAILSKLDDVKTTFTTGGGRNESTPVKTTKVAAAKAESVITTETKARMDGPSENDIPDDNTPLPDDADVAGKADLSEYDMEHPVVEKLKDMFHGEVVKKGE
jgi:DNA polymerase-3 subunit gamma/tau